MPQAASAAASPQSSLQRYSRAVLEGKSLADRKRLETFAAQSKDPAQAALARLALGYFHYEQKNHSAAAQYLAAAQVETNPLSDYADYYAALNAEAQGNAQRAAKILESFPVRHSAGPLAASPLAPQAALRYAQILISLAQPAEAAKRLEEALALPQPESAFFLARAYELSGRKLEAAKAYQKVYYDYPLAPEAAEAGARLPPLRRSLGDAYPAVSPQQLQSRADILFARSRWREAEAAYRALASALSAQPGYAAQRQQASVRAAVCQYQAGATWPALNALQAMQLTDPAADAERLYIMSLGYRRLKRPDQMKQQLDLLASRYPQSEWHEKALISAGNNYLLEKDYDRAGDYYRRAFQEFPQGDGAAYGHWKVAWQAYRERKLPQARRLLEEHISNFPNSPQISASLYWLARLMERESAAVSAQYYRKLQEAFPNYYYSLLARERLASLPKPLADNARTIPLDRIQRRTGVSLQTTLTPAEAQAAERIGVLESAWLIDWAIEELTPLLPATPAASWAGGEIARLEELRGQHHVALRYAKRYVPSYFSQNITELPPEIWRRLFPIPYWEQIKQRAAQSQLDPYLVAGLIRQESEFNPEARSRSNARGLMQLLPSTARMVARKVPDRQARNYRLGLLFQPQFNLIYGTLYFKSVLDRFDGSLEQALASYNAGPGRVQQWLADGDYEEPAEFVESIPFTETREYVQAVLRNAHMYRQLYSPPASAANGNGSSAQ